MEERLLSYINNRLKDIYYSLGDGLITSEDLMFLEGQKDELETIKKMILDKNLR